MENLRELQINRTLEKGKRVSRTRSKVKLKLNTLKFKRFLIALNLSLMVIMATFLAIGYNEMVDISSNNKILAKENNELEVQISSLNTILEPFVAEKRIEKIAMTRLNMVYPSSESIAKLDENSGERIITLNDFTTRLEKQKSQPFTFFSLLSNIFR